MIYHNLYHNKILLDIFLLECDFCEDDCVVQKEEVEPIRMFSFDEMIDILTPRKDDIYIDIVKKIKR